MNVDNCNQLRLESVDQVWCFLQYTNGQYLPGSDYTPSTLLRLSEKISSLKKAFICICEKVNGCITTNYKWVWGTGGGAIFALWDSFKLIIIIVTKSNLALIVPSQVKIQVLLIDDLMEMFRVCILFLKKRLIWKWKWSRRVGQK